MEEGRIEIIQYLRKRKGPKTGPKTGPKKGVLFCGIDPHSLKNVIVGFSLCNSIDTFDYVNKERKKGFGVNLAKQRAIKWSFYTDFFVQKSHTEAEIEKEIAMKEQGEINYLVNPNPQFVVEIQPSVIDPLKNFIERCRRYYKDKDFPEWVKRVEKESPIVCLEEESFIYIGENE